MKKIVCKVSPGEPSAGEPRNVNGDPRGMDSGDCDGVNCRYTLVKLPQFEN